MTKALISIDYTFDFVADEGKLTAGAPAQAISKSIAQVTQLAFDQGAYILMLMMWTILFIRRASSSHLIISLGPVDETCTVP